VVLAYGGGALAGLLTAWLAVRTAGGWTIRCTRTGQPADPFTAFLLAELVHASGVLAVVVCGLTLSQIGPRLVRADTRNRPRRSGDWPRSCSTVRCSCSSGAGARGDRRVGPVRGDRGARRDRAGLGGGDRHRFAWIYTTPYVIRAIDRRPQQRLRRVGARQRMVNAVCGFRGAVSLAAALAVPELTVSGTPFPDRDQIVLITSGVVVVTLVLQALVLPAVVRWARLPADTALEEERRLAEATASESAFAALPEIADRLEISDAVLSRVRAEYEHHRQVVGSSPDSDEDRVAAARGGRVHGPASGVDRPQARHHRPAPRPARHRRHRAAAHSVQTGHEEVRLARREVLD
jgi:CPA1 family monovalent cation:H+ antiporter